MPSSHLILCRPLLLLPPNPSQHQSLFQWVNSSHQVTKVSELQLQHQSFQWILRTDFLWDLLVWSTCCSKDFQESSPAPQFKSVNYLVLSLLYSSTLNLRTWLLKKPWLWIDTRQTFVDKVMSLLFNMLSQSVIAFLPRSKCVLISWELLSAVIFGVQENKVFHSFHCFSIYLPWGNGTGHHDLRFLNVEF